MMTIHVHAWSRSLIRLRARRSSGYLATLVLGTYCSLCSGVGGERVQSGRVALEHGDQVITCGLGYAGGELPAIGEWVAAASR